MLTFSLPWELRCGPLGYQASSRALPALRTPLGGSDHDFRRISAYSEPGRRTCARWDPVLASRTCPGVPQGPADQPSGGLLRRVPGGRSRQRKAEARRERDAEIRGLLEATLKKLQEGVP